MGRNSVHWDWWQVQHFLRIVSTSSSFRSTLSDSFHIEGFEVVTKPKPCNATATSSWSSPAQPAWLIRTAKRLKMFFFGTLRTKNPTIAVRVEGWFRIYSASVKGRGALPSSVLKNILYTEYTEQMQGYPEGLVSASNTSEARYSANQPPSLTLIIVSYLFWSFECNKARQSRSPVPHSVIRVQPNAALVIVLFQVSVFLLNVNHKIKVASADYSNRFLGPQRGLTLAVFSRSLANHVVVPAISA